MPASDHVVGDLDYSAATTSSGRVTVLPDNEGGSSALDNEGSNGPTLSTSNGSTIATYSAAEFLDWPIQSGVNGRTTVQGFAYWFRPHTVAPASGFQETLTTWNTSGGASGTRLNITQSNAALEVYGGPGAPTWVRSVASFFSANVWQFLYIHFDGGASGEARLRVFSCDTSGTVTEHTTTAAVGSLGTTLPSVTGTQIIGAYDDGGTDAVDGDYGQHLWALDGLLTTGEIQELANIDPPVDLGLGLNATGTGQMAAFTATGAASTIDASGTGQMGAFTATGAAVHALVASGTGQMAAFSATGAASVPGASGTGQVGPFTAAGAATLEVAGAGAGQMAAFSATGVGTVDVVASGAGQIAAFTAAGVAALVREASGIGQMAAFSAAGTAELVTTVDAEVLATEVLRLRVEATDVLRSTCAGRDQLRARVTGQDG